MVLSTGIYIEGVEMPKNHNHVTITIWSNGAANYGLHDRGESLVDFRSVEVVPIPPHGRLIDADNIGMTNFEIILCQKGNPFKNALEMLLEKIENAPTVIPADTAEEGE